MVYRLGTAEVCVDQPPIHYAPAMATTPLSATSSCLCQHRQLGGIWCQKGTFITAYSPSSLKFILGSSRDQLHNWDH